MTLPAPLTRFVGRERELTELTRLLGRTRLATLTGAGGVGKTRLALAVAEELDETFAHGAAFVDLAPVAHSDAVIPTIARTLGIRDDGELPLMERLANALRERELLLILDNFEHVLSAAQFVLEFLQAAPRLTVLVTSRAALRVRGEREFPVAPLACPDPTTAESVDGLLRYPALELFVERARDVRPDFSLAEANAVSVVEICRRLDGMPLALELAAARIRVLPPEAMLARLGHGLALLTGGPRDLPARQQTIRATIAWSYDLLNPAERALFRRLSVFVDDFSLDAALAVAGATASTSLDLVGSLVEKNLLRQTEGSDRASRFRMLETVREFGREQLEASGEADGALRAHAAFFVALVEDAAPHLRRAQRELWMQRIDVEMDNLRSVVAWSSTATDRGDALMRIVRALGFLYWRIRGHLHEGLSWSELALATPAAPSPSAQRARLLWAAGGLAGYMGRQAQARAWAEDGVRLARASGDGTDLGFALVILGFVESRLGDGAAAMHLQEGIAVLRAVGEQHDLAIALDVAIAPYVELGDVATARATLADSLSISRELGDEWAVAVALSSAGFLEVSERNWSSAVIHMEQALAIFGQLGDEGSMAIICNNLGVVARQQGDDARAAELFEQSLAMHRRLGLNEAVPLCHLGDLALRHGDTARATTLLAEALRAASRGGESRAIVLSLCRLARLATALRQPEAAAPLLGAANALYERADVGIRRELDDAADLARSTLGEARFRAAAADGETTPLARLTADTLVWVESLPFVPADGSVPAARPNVLSTREMEVLRLIARGKSNREIASALVISLNTVARHVSNIFDKLGAANRTEAAAYAHQHALAD